jgi:hypothetical protein
MAHGTLANVSPHNGQRCRSPRAPTLPSHLTSTKGRGPVEVMGTCHYKSIIISADERHGPRPAPEFRELRRTSRIMQPCETKVGSPHLGFSTH